MVCPDVPSCIAILKRFSEVDDRAAFVLGHMYIKGTCGDELILQGISMLRTCVKKNFRPALLVLGMFLVFQSQNPRFKKLITREDMKCACCNCPITVDGVLQEGVDLLLDVVHSIGTAKDQAEAFFALFRGLQFSLKETTAVDPRVLFQFSVQSKYPAALFLQGNMWRNEGVLFTKVLAAWEEAAKLRFIPAMIALARHHIAGCNTDGGRALSRHWFLESSKEGFELGAMIASVLDTCVRKGGDGSSGNCLLCDLPCIDSENEWVLPAREMRWKHVHCCIEKEIWTQEASDNMKDLIGWVL
jgi:hypothetical protein